MILFTGRTLTKQGVLPEVYVSVYDKSSEKKINTDHHHSNKYITTQEFDKLTSKIFASRLAQANLLCKNDIANFLKKTYLMIN